MLIFPCRFKPSPCVMIVLTLSLMEDLSPQDFSDHTIKTQKLGFSDQFQIYNSKLDWPLNFSSSPAWCELVMCLGRTGPSSLIFLCQVRPDKRRSRGKSDWTHDSTRHCRKYLLTTWQMFTPDSFSHMYFCGSLKDSPIESYKLQLP